MVPGYSNDTKSCKWCNSWMNINETICTDCGKSQDGETQNLSIDLSTVEGFGPFWIDDSKNTWLS